MMMAPSAKDDTSRYVLGVSAIDHAAVVKNFMENSRHYLLLGIPSPTFVWGRGRSHFNNV